MTGEGLEGRRKKKWIFYSVLACFRHFVVTCNLKLYNKLLNQKLLKTISTKPQIFENIQEYIKVVLI